MAAARAKVGLAPSASDAELAQAQAKAAAARAKVGLAPSASDAELAQAQAKEVKKVGAIDGLETLMSSLGLEDKLPDAANWCEVNGADSVRDIHEADYAEQLAKDLGLPLVQANKLIKAIKKLAPLDRTWTFQLRSKRSQLLPRILRKMP